ncbi:MAG: PilZ domain-containing protein [Endomicrobia bacterium]|nr:PilZ domain-containing protein [Endomicrobiia bacterium]
MERYNKSKYTGPERRKYKRLNVYHLDVPIQIKTNDENLFLPGILLDISAGGVGILCFKDIPLGTRVRLSIALHNIRTGVITAKVIWVKKQDKTYRIGFQFIDISKKDSEQINQFVEQHLREDM